MTSTFYITPFTSSGRHTSVRQQTNYLREYATQHFIPFSLPIVEWAIPGVYFRLFESISLSSTGRIFILSRDMLPSQGTALWLLLTQYLYVHDVSIVSLGIEEDHSVYENVEGWKMRLDGTFELKPQRPDFPCSS